MAIISDFEEEEEKQPEAKPLASSSSSASSSAAAEFIARFDPSSLLGFIEEAFEFVAERSDFLAHEAAERDIAAVLRAVREKQKQKLRPVEKERERAKKAKAVAVAAAAKKVDEEKKVQEVEMKDAKEEKEEKSGAIGVGEYIFRMSMGHQLKPLAI